MVLSSDEIDELAATADVESSLLTEWLYSAEFDEEVICFHKSLF